MHSAGRARLSGLGCSTATLVLALCTALVGTACKKDPQGSDEGGVSSGKPAAPPPVVVLEDSGVKGARRPVSTSWAIAGHNLDAEIKDRVKRAYTEPDQASYLVALYVTRGQTLANVEDYEKAEIVAADLVKSSPKNGIAHLAHALTLGALHKFDADDLELDEAARLGAPAERVASARVALYEATGKYDEALKLMPPVTDHSKAPAIVTAAVLATHMQKTDEAEALFEKARTAFVDVTPFPIAWMDFQRGALLEAAGKEKEARGYYLEALEAIPVYAHAAVHAAITDAPDRAITRLESVKAVSSDPDVLAALADAHKRAKHDAEAKKAVEAARVRYEELLVKHPEAYRDHAARFYLAAGNDSKKALDLADKNAKLRPTEEAIDLWMAAATAANDKPAICASANAMKQLRYASEPRKRLAAAASNGCPDSPPPSPAAMPATDAGAK
jgi:tetratricopeptide (TPR) repeat protein